MAPIFQYLHRQGDTERGATICEDATACEKQNLLLPNGSSWVTTHSKRKGTQCPSFHWSGIVSSCQSNLQGSRTSGNSASLGTLWKLSAQLSIWIFIVQSDVYEKHAKSCVEYIESPPVLRFALGRISIETLRKKTKSRLFAHFPQRFDEYWFYHKSENGRRLYA